MGIEDLRKKKVSLVNALFISFGFIATWSALYLSIVDSRADLKIEKESLEMKKQYQELSNDFQTMFEEVILLDSIHKTRIDSITKYGLIVTDSLNQNLSSRNIKITSLNDSILLYYQPRVDSFFLYKKENSLLTEINTQYQSENNFLKSKNDSLSTIVTAIMGENSNSKLVIESQKKFIKARGLEAMNEAQKFERFGNSEKGFFKSKVKRLNFYILSKTNYQIASNLGVSEASAGLRRVIKIIDELDKDDITGGTKGY